jgi:hypothetical protein
MNKNKCDKCETLINCIHRSEIPGTLRSRRTKEAKFCMDAGFVLCPFSIHVYPALAYLHHV